MNVKYKWLTLSSDGLLREPDDVGVYYESSPVNGYEGCFDSKEEAIQRIIVLRGRYEYGCSDLNGLILVEKYFFD